MTTPEQSTNTLDVVERTDPPASAERPANKKRGPNVADTGGE